jgi:hypothetical protein
MGQIKEIKAIYYIEYSPNHNNNVSLFNYCFIDFTHFIGWGRNLSKYFGNFLDNGVSRKTVFPDL